MPTKYRQEAVFFGTISLHTCPARCEARHRGNLAVVTGVVPVLFGTDIFTASCSVLSSPISRFAKRTTHRIWVSRAKAKVSCAGPRRADHEYKRSVSGRHGQPVDVLRSVWTTQKAALTTLAHKLTTPAWNKRCRGANVPYGPDALRLPHQV